MTSQLTVFFNLGSIVLGLGAWACAVGAFKKQQLSAVSFALCAFALLFQLLEVNNRVRSGDLSAIMDTIQAVSIAACVLPGVSVIINAAAFFKTGSRRKQNKAG